MKIKITKPRINLHHLWKGEMLNLNKLIYQWEFRPIITDNIFFSFLGHTKTDWLKGNQVFRITASIDNPTVILPLLIDGRQIIIQVPVPKVKKRRPS